MWQSLKKKIHSILQANNLLEQVFDFEAGEFAGDPVATIVSSANESNYRSTINNRRIYVFTIQLLVKRANPRTDAEAENILTDLVDSVLDDFDKYYTFGTGSPGAALSLPTGYAMIMVEALPSKWFYSQRETLYRGAEVEVRVHMDVDVTTI